MKIKSIRTNGFKSLGDFELTFHDNLNIFIGSNNVGKSNIIKALNAFFNKDKLDPSDLPLSLNNFLSNRFSEFDYSYEIEICFTDLPDSIINNSPSAIFDNKLVMKARFINNDKSFLIKRISDSWDKIHETHYIFKEHLPSFIYLGDLSDKEISVQSLNQYIKLPNLESIQRIETFANQLIKDIWDQQIAVSLHITNPEQMLFDVTIIDEHGNSNAFRDKSSGVQQLTYLVLFFAYNLMLNKSDYVLALEEPETNLHVGIQRKLFKYLKAFSTQIQIFLTTHSQIFLDRADHECVFHVKRNVDKETIVSTNAVRNNWFELKNDLGIHLSDSLFLGQYNLVVEGLSEKILFPRIMELFLNRNNASFHLDEINIFSAEGVSNSHFYAKVISETGLSTCVIVDNDQPGKNALDKISKDKSLTNKVNIIMLEREGFDSCELEDMMEDELLVSALNIVHESSITVEDLQNARKNPNKGEDGPLDKFSEAFKRLYPETSVQKAQLAVEVKNLLTDYKHLSLLEKQLKAMFSWFKSR
ncbi:ATP-dependent nuclease [Paenibacillus sp. UNC451MF]|uniref:ATP-dependent nuclease n=1 Tax=Paenibacillus sp. UNC451MF TaxID=1449063 RepID=UPI00048D4EC8|nr:AAA family ATPase [Paenibacillus sp. UNC451MF]